MRISDWSSDVCSSDLAVACGLGRGAMSRFDADFATVLDAAAAVGNRRVLKTADPEGAARMRRKGRLLTDFSGNDYLGLSHHPLLKDRAGEGAARRGAGGGRPEERRVGTEGGRTWRARW